MKRSQLQFYVMLWKSVINNNIFNSIWYQICTALVLHCHIKVGDNNLNHASFYEEITVTILRHVLKISDQQQYF